MTELEKMENGLLYDPGDAEIVKIQLEERLVRQAEDERAQEALEIELVGLCTDICVVSNALLLKAAMPEAHITVDAACCAGVTVAKHEAALEVMRSCQIEVI